MARWCARFARSYPAASGLVFDLPHAEAQTEQAIARDNLTGRCRFVGGDFYERVPSGADAYLLKSVLHDWDDDSCVAILKSIRAAMRPDSRILIVERPLSMAPDVVMSDLTMLAMTPGGRERALTSTTPCTRAGLTIERVVPTSVHVSVYRRECHPEAVRSTQSLAPGRQHHSRSSPAR